MSVSTEPLLHVVLYQPEIPQNTGNIGRTCVAVGAKLWLIRPLGFELDSRHLRRAGMDYWEHLNYEIVDSWSELREKLPDRPWWCVTKFATRLIWEATFQPADVLLFGNESRGLPETIHNQDPSRRLKLPMHPQVRCLNLASTVNTVVYEAVRQFGGLPEEPTWNSTDGKAGARMMRGRANRKRPLVSSATIIGKLPAASLLGPVRRSTLISGPTAVPSMGHTRGDL